MFLRTQSTPQIIGQGGIQIGVPSRKKAPLNSKSSERGEILGIGIIDAIARKVTSGFLSSEHILSAINQILYFYKFLPDPWKRKAYEIFKKVWDMGQVIISTDPEKPKQIYEVEFEDERINSIMKTLSIADKSAMYQGKAMIDLIERGLHFDSDAIKNDVKEQYGLRGKHIVDILTTGDINYLFDDIKDLSDSKEVLAVFNWWVENYPDFALLIPNPNLNKTYIKNQIVRLSKLLKKDYILLHYTGNFLEITKAQKLITEALSEKIITFKTIENNIEDSGFCKALHIIIRFK